MIIEKGIPIPESKVEPTITSLIQEMVSGDSIVIHPRSRAGVHNLAKRFNKQVVTRKIGENEIRVWVK